MSDKPTNKYLAAATAHYRSLGTPSLTVPEWTVEGPDGKPIPVKIFWKPLSAAERTSIAEGRSDDLEVFLLKALDGEGKRMFTLDDKPTLNLFVAPQIISRVASKMMDLPTPEVVIKN
jgi:hypothetical protein